MQIKVLFHSIYSPYLLHLLSPLQHTNTNNQINPSTLETTKHSLFSHSIIFSHPLILSKPTKKKWLLRTTLLPHTSSSCS